MAGVQRVRQYDKLKKNGATDFQGTTDPMEAEHWLRSTERVFDQMEYTSEERLDYAVSLLQDDAFDWWETIVKQYGMAMGDHLCRLPKST